MSSGNTERLSVVALALLTAVLLASVFYNRSKSSPTPLEESPETPAVASQDDLVSEIEMHADGVDIVFPGNHPVQVIWRRPPHLDYDFGDEGQDYQTLRGIAESGDGAAAYLLSDLLDRCVSAFATREGMENALNGLRQTSSIVFPGNEYETHFDDSEAGVSTAIEHIRRTFEDCQGVSAEQKSESADWLQQSADTGFLPAMMERAYEVDDHEVAIKLFTQAWESGESGALQGLSKRYYANWQAGLDPTGKVHAYATLYLYTQIVEAGLGPDTGHGEIAGRQLARIQKTLDQATADMFDQEIDEAIAIATSMLESNGNCCFGM